MLGVFVKEDRKFRLSVYNGPTTNKQSSLSGAR
jgi:hypothetical protein